MAEKQYRRFNDNTKITQGTESGSIKGTDIIPMQHLTGDNEDKAIEIRQLLAVPQLYVGSFSDNTATPTFLNYSSFEPVLGMQFDITFGAEFTGTALSIVLLDGSSTKSYPVKASGTAVGKSFNKGTKRSFKATVKTTATTTSAAQTKTNWYIDLDSNVVSVIDDVITYSDGTTGWTGSKINSALANYHKKEKTTITGTEDTTYTVTANETYIITVQMNYFGCNTYLVSVNGEKTKSLIELQKLNNRVSVQWEEAGATNNYNLKISKSVANTCYLIISKLT